MKISYVVAESPGNVALKTAEYDPQTLKPDEVLLKIIGAKRKKFKEIYKEA